MRIRARTVAIAVLLVAAGAGATGCQPGDDQSVTRKAVPKFTGMGLQAAQDAAEAAGFRHLTSHDSAGRDRKQILDRNWQVCTQKPAAGTRVATDDKLDFGTVKLEESCPSTDRKPPPKAGRTMPNFVGKGLNTATDSLPSNTSITSKDATGDRVILLRSNWKVCSQNPKSGSRLTGQPVAFTAVKYGEDCP